MTNDTGAAVNRFDVIVVGAGFAGIYTLYRLKKMGLRVRVLEAGSGVGGTWYWNRYPGARCDVESLEYSYSFSEDLQRDWDWPDRFSRQPDILHYINHVVDRFDLRGDIQTETHVVSVTYSDEEHRWNVVTSQGESFEAQFCIMATGMLSLPRIPKFEGLDRFKGRWFHSGLWPEEEVDFGGRTVGVIGTGSSGIQMIPILAEQAKQLFVFQRTANFSLPAMHRPLTQEVLQRHKSEYGKWREASRKTPFAIGGYPPPTKAALEVDDEARRQAYEAKWKSGGTISFLYSYKDLLTDKEANDTASEFVREKIRGIVNDPVTAELLCPTSHPIGTKRLCLDDNYFATFNRDNVSLVDVRSAPIVEITPDGVRTERSHYQLDDIVFATGFDAMTGALLDIEIATTKGSTLRAKWADGPRLYLGLMVAGFPNLFTITGPLSPSVKTNMVASIEQHVEWIADCLQYMREKDFDTVDADIEAQDAWVTHVGQVAEKTLYPLANSWYMGANVPGKPRVFMPYVAGFDKYREICTEIAAADYRGFTFTSPAAAISKISRGAAARL